MLSDWSEGITAEILHVDAGYNAMGSPGPGVSSAEVEGFGLVHEIGHTLGLTGSSIPMITPHQDSAHGYHDIDDNAVMHWLLNIAPIPSLGSSQFAQYDDNSKADMAAFGGLASPAVVSAAEVADAELFAEYAETVGACATCSATDGHQHSHANGGVGGAGMKGGIAVGKTNSDGTSVETEPYTSQDVMATVCKALGISLETTFTSKNGRPMKIANSGKVIKELFA